MKKTIKSLMFITILLTAGIFVSGCEKEETNVEDNNNELKVKTETNKLYKIDNAKISISKHDENYNYMKISGDTRNEILVAIPIEIKKGVGELELASIDVLGNTGKYTVSFRFKISNEDDFIALTNYYKSLDGTVTNEINNTTFYMDFKWGKIFQCEYDKDSNTIQVSVSIN